jgi:hypothetical protein
MKIIKLSLLALLAMNVAVVSAQEQIQNKNGVDILPKEGQFALGFNAVPLINIIGNATAGQNKFINNLFGQNAIYGKYMLSSNTAIRGSFAFNFDNFKNRNFVIDNTLNSPDSLVTDAVTLNSQTFSISGGYEMRRGSGRLQAIYGGDLAFSISSANRSFEYGNAFGQINQTPTSTNWSGAGFAFGSSSQGERSVEIIDGRTMRFGLRPFVGLEYFFAPNISLGAEFGWTVAYSATADGETTREYYSPSEDQTFKRTIPNAGSRGFNGGVDNLNGAVTLMFYF